MVEQPVSRTLTECLFHRLEMSQRSLSRATRAVLRTADIAQNSFGAESAAAVKARMRHQAAVRDCQRALAAFSELVLNGRAPENGHPGLELRRAALRNEVHAERPAYGMGRASDAGSQIVSNGEKRQLQPVGNR
jgi:hypothetical protein